MQKSLKLLKKLHLPLVTLVISLTATMAAVALAPQAVTAQTSKDQFNSNDSSTACPPGKFVKDDGSPCATPRDLPTPTDSNPSIIDKLINPFITLMTAIVGIIIAISLVAAAITYSAAGGDPSKVAAAKKRITNSIIALIAYIFTFGIIEWLVPGGLY